MACGGRNGSGHQSLKKGSKHMRGGALQAKCCSRRKFPPCERSPSSAERIACRGRTQVYRGEEYFQRSFKAPSLSKKRTVPCLYGKRVKSRCTRLAHFKKGGGRRLRVRAASGQIGGGGGSKRHKRLVEKGKPGNPKRASKRVSDR